MSPSKTDATQRRDEAEAALRCIDSTRAQSQALNLRCHAAHHVAVVYRTDVGLVYAARTGPYRHDGRDEPGSEYDRGQPGPEYLDLVGPDDTAGNILPAWCACGPLMVSRRDIMQWIREGRRTVRLP